MSKTNKVIHAIENSKHCIVFTGAGISTMSGIPDFRGQKIELWKKYDQSRIFEINYFSKNPEYFYNFAREVFPDMINAKPNIVHKLVAKLYKDKYIKQVITQNIDMLHQKSGVKDVFELHGSPIISYCVKCNKEYSIKDVMIKITDFKIPVCDNCKGLIKPDIVFYGEPLNAAVLNESFNNAVKADLCLVLGTSLVVYPAAVIPEMVVQHGGKIIIVNKDETHLDNIALYKFDDLKCFAEEIFGRL